MKKRTVRFLHFIRFCSWNSFSFLFCVVGAFFLPAIFLCDSHFVGTFIWRMRRATPFLSRNQQNLLPVYFIRILYHLSHMHNDFVFVLPQFSQMKMKHSDNHKQQEKVFASFYLLDLSTTFLRSDLLASKCRLRETNQTNHETKTFLLLFLLLMSPLSHLFFIYFL